jgi:hypothetical protein
MNHHADIKLDVKVGVATYAYAVVLGAAYLFSFWRPFGLSIFPFLSATDFITLPLNRISILVVPLLLALFLYAGAFLERNAKPSLPLLYLLIGLSILSSAQDLVRAIVALKTFGTVYENEKTIFVVLFLLYFVGIALVYWVRNGERKLTYTAMSILLSQLAVVIAAGYADGKALYNGADQAYFLQERQLCAPPDYGNWVYLGKGGATVFFMNTKDKRICISDSLRFNLVNRHVVDSGGM